MSEGDVHSSRMAASLMLAAAGVALFWAVSLVSGLLANIAKAKQTNLRYLVVFCPPDHYGWYEIQKLVLPIMRMVMPASWWDNWLFVMKRDWSFHNGQRPWDRLGECFLVVSPSSVYFYTRSPDVIQQITSRRDDFTKPTHLYRLLARYGDNVLTTEGAVWRMHRRATSTIFSERLAASTFAEAVRQARAMVGHWERSNDSDDDGRTVHDLAGDVMRLTLNVFGSVGFGMHFPWPGEPPSKDADPSTLKYTTIKPTSKHTMTLPRSLEAVLHQILTLVIFPGWLLRVLPFGWAKTAFNADTSYKHHMAELLRQRKQELIKPSSDDSVKGQAKPGEDIISSLLKVFNTTSSGEKPNSTPLSDTDIIGNAFILILAGHETSGDVLHFALLYLALHPAAQRALQADLDRIMPHKEQQPSWEQASELLASMPGAVVNETMRTIPPVVHIPKLAAGDQPLMIDGRECMIPAETVVQIVAVAVHRHPRYWPPPPEKAGKGGAVSDVDEWKPERWFRPSTNTNTTNEHDDSSSNNEDRDMDIETDKNAPASTLTFRPARGAFVPFSDGARSCLGRRMAQVEMVASLAALLRTHSVELAVDDLASREEVDGMDAVQRRELYGRASERARRVIGQAYTLLTLSLQDGDHVPVRFVPRGRERFVGVV